MKVPAIPALVVGIVLGFLSQIFVQGGSLIGGIEALQSGFTIATGNVMVDALFNRGGLDSMMYTVSMTIVAMTFGGILEFSGMLQALMNQLLKVVKVFRIVNYLDNRGLFLNKCILFRAIYLNRCTITDVQ